MQLFFEKNAAEVQGEKPWSLSADSETFAPCFWRTEKRVRKSTDFRGKANTTAFPGCPFCIGDSVKHPSGMFYTEAFSNDFFHDSGYCKNRPFFSNPYAVYNSTPISDAVIHTAPQP